MTAPLLSVNQLSYRVVDRTLLDDVTFDLNYGQKVALVGRSGSGKSVLLQALADLLPQVDFLTLHCPLTQQTQDLIAEQELALMKNSAFLINCARGGLVNEQALATALRQGMIAGAATDVLTVEPPKNGNVLLSADIPNLIITPHSAWGSRDSRQRMLQQLLENVMAFQAGKPIRQVN